MENFEIAVTELELKYKADEIKLADFVKFANSMNPEKQIQVASWDVYYSGDNLPFEFMRFRNGPTPELTIKIKMDEKNNNNRIEVDLPLMITVSEWIVSKFVGLFGFKENFRVYKFCDIYWYEKLDIVFYIVYNTDMTELGRFIEIEARKDTIFTSKEEAWALVKEMETKMGVLGISAANRTKLSLWERFRKKKE